VRYSRNRLPKGKTDWAAVDAMTDREVARRATGDADTRLTTAAFWRNAHLVLPGESGKEVVTLRLDRWRRPSGAELDAGLIGCFSHWRCQSSGRP